MRRILALLVPVLALGASYLEPVTVKDPDPTQHAARPAALAHVAGEPRFLVGTVDTVGGSTFDWQANGPIWRFLVNSADYGLHVAWMYSAWTSTTFPDRNMRYNFYDYAWENWAWLDPDFMQSAINVFMNRAGYGSLDADPNTGCALVSCHMGSTTVYPVVARDAAPGAGIFEYCDGQPQCDGYKWVPMCVDSTGKPHTALIDDLTDDNLYYSGVQPWCTWSTPYRIPPPRPDPAFPSHNIAASKVSRKVCITWTTYSGVAPDPGFYRVSTDGGSTWGASTELPWPDAYGPDTLESYHISSLFPFYDRGDVLHIAASVMPYVDGTGYVIPAQIWHWCADNDPEWNRVTIATCDTSNLVAAVGYNAIYATRPSLGEDNDGNLFIAWEQFDSADVFTGPPELLCADVFIAASADNGLTWTEPFKLTDAEDISFRFPSVVDLAIDGGADVDTVCVGYYTDLWPGFFVQGEGAATANPYVVHRIPVDSFAGYRGTVVRPSAGESWRGGDTCTIRWRIRPHDYDSVRVLLSFDSGATYPDTLAEGLPPADSLFEWEVPDYNCDECRIRVEAYTVADEVVFVTESGIFTIDSEEPTVPLLAYPPDSSQTIEYPVELGWHAAQDSLGAVSYHLQVATDSLFVDTLELPDPVGPDTWCVVDPPPLYDYWWRVRAGDEAGNWSDWSEAWTFYIFVGVAEEPGAVFGLGPARPNPFRRSAELRLALPGPAGPIAAAVYNAAGRLVAPMSELRWSEKARTVTWTPGPAVRPGVYYLRCRAGGRDYVQRLVLIE